MASIESMKMEYVIKATHECKIAKIDVTPGQFVNMKQKLISFEAL